MLSFNDLLRKSGYLLETVRYLRHKESDASRPDLYEMWRTDRTAFDSYQSEHTERKHAMLLKATCWASFVGTRRGETLFAGLYRASFSGRCQNRMSGDGTTTRLYYYDIEPEPCLGEYAGRILIDWGGGNLAYVQRADRQDKQIIELRRRFEDPAFPGYLNFIQNFSSLETLPDTWIAMLRAAKGVYALTCPRTRELYIGSAYGVDGFFGRWTTEARDGHGGNVQLKSRDRSDYQVSILEIAGSALSDAEIIALESRWKDKLQTRSMGLNSN